MSKNDIVEVLKTKEFDVLITMGAGNIDQLIEPICEMLNQKFTGK